MSYQGQQNRTEWYDRNPTIVTQNFGNANLAPHAQTTRWTYTIPANRKAIIEAGLVQCIRSATAGAAGQCTGVVQVNSVSMVLAFFINAAADSGRVLTFGATLTLLAGNTLSALSEDLSTGGTTSTILTAKATEYDA